MASAYPDFGWPPPSWFEADLCQFDVVVCLELLVRICLLPFSGGNKYIYFIYIFIMAVKSLTSSNH